MSDFGICYIRTPGIYTEMCEMSKATLPSGTKVHEVVVRDHHESLVERLRLVNHLPFKRTLYIDCDTIYGQSSWPEFVNEMELPFGVAMSAWFLIHQPWMWPVEWKQYLNRNIPSMLRASPVLRAPNAGLMLLEKTPESMELFRKWEQVWASSKCPLIEPAYIKSVLKDTHNRFTVLPGGFHVPSWAFDSSLFGLPIESRYFTHIITNPVLKLAVMKELSNGTV